MSRAERARKRNLVSLRLDECKWEWEGPNSTPANEIPFPTPVQEIPDDKQGWTLHQLGFIRGHHELHSVPPPPMIVPPDQVFTWRPDGWSAPHTITVRLVPGDDVVENVPTLWRVYELASYVRASSLVYKGITLDPNLMLRQIRPLIEETTKIHEMSIC